ncbi:hypothetical protein [Corynebacterium variabile]|uniref:hypothetical protein n=1 Tax=Corynebacterium variabile TaxID=1727 RepID=UPI003F982F45
MFSDQLPNWAEGLTALISAATLFAVFLAAIQIRHLNKQMHREFEMQYLTRFWQLTDKFSTDMKMEGIVTREDAVLMHDYFALTNDQIELRAAGRVTDQTWKLWRDDIKKLCATEPFNKELEKSKETYQVLTELMSTEDYDFYSITRQAGKIKLYFQGL